MDGETSCTKHNSDDFDFTNSIFSWSIDDILDENLFKNKVEKIELSFESIDHYLGSFFNPLLEETRAQICSSMEILYKAPYAEVISPINNSVVKRLYKLEIKSWKSRFHHHGESYKASPDDILVLADYKPENVKELKRVGRMWSSVSVDDFSYQEILSELNESQNKAISACLSGLNCNHNSAVKLIWGPPGTGKTKTLATLLFVLLKMNYRVLVCAPTNVAIKELASRVVTLVKEANSKRYGDLFCPMGELLLFGSNERLKIGEDIRDIYWDHRVKQLKECFSSPTGFIPCLESMIYLLKNCALCWLQLEKEERERKTFLEFLRERVRSQALLLKDTSDAERLRSG
ncbi:uncharacterized protein LOC114188359 [Vigna unguiculata]|uniref:uncharacterized protein LOC114188359 n=1 Tax=Vigna unguiculata TaxID=3917 RepID=UPI001016B1EE|nr:uncharacterized protein LOC114188359 [Vigna unguiculata]